jgi:hypothetical protein
MADEKDIRADMEVVGSDGRHVGTVDRVEGNQIKLTKNDPDAGGQHHFISLNSIDSVVESKVTLKQPAGEAKARWTTA